MKVFVNSVDATFGHNLSNILAQTVVGNFKREDNDEDEIQDELNPTEEGLGTSEKPKEFYKVVGSIQKDDPNASSSLFPSVVYAKPGIMIETGDRKKDALRREAIEKLPKKGIAPKGCSESVSASDKEALQKLLLESDVIVFDILNDLDTANWALEFLASNIDNFEKPKTFVAISTVMTWAKTKIDADDPEAAFPEDEYRRRKPHPSFKDYLDLEKNLVKYSKKEKFKSYIIAAGLIYHSGNSIFHYLFKDAWHNEPALTCYGEGSNILPCIHLDDLVSITAGIIDSHPENKYILAVDDSKSSLYEITKAIADSLSNGNVQKVAKEEALLQKSFSQKDYEMLTVNLRLEPAFIKEMQIEWKFESGIIENLPQLIQEYKDARGLWALKIVVHGPPASGKTYLAQKIAEKYKIHYLEPEEIVQQSLYNLERRVNNARNSGSEEGDIEGDKEYLNELKETLRTNNGRLNSGQILGFVRDKIRSMPCKNQGYILDGFPTSVDEASELFKPADEDSKEDKPITDEVICPEFIFTIEMSDLAIKQRIQKLPESQLSGAKNSEEALIKRLEEYRKANTDELTVLNYFDEMEIAPIKLQVENAEFNLICAQVWKEIGEPRNYGLTPEQIAIELRDAEEKRLKAEAEAAEEQAKREKEELDRHKRVTMEWNAKLEQVRKQEEEVLQIQSEPLRNYLVKYIMPTLTAGLVEVAKIRPEDPIDYLAEYLFKQNPENNS